MGLRVKVLVSARSVAAGVLLVASVAKAWAAPDFHAQNATLLIAAIEVLLALWLVIGWLSTTANAAVCVLFATFCFLSVNRIVGGSERCNCFGSIRLNNWVMLTLTFTLTVALAIDQPIVLRFMRANRLSLPQISRFLATAGAVVAIGNSAVLAFDVQESRDERTQWAARVLKLLSASSQLPPAHCNICVVQHQCPSCREFLRSLESAIARDKQVRAWLILEVPPFSDEIARKLYFPRGVPVVSLNLESPPCLPMEIECDGVVIRSISCKRNGLTWTLD